MDAVKSDEHLRVVFAHPAAQITVHRTVPQIKDHGLSVISDIDVSRLSTGLAEKMLMRLIMRAVLDILRTQSKLLAWVKFRKCC